MTRGVAPPEVAEFARIQSICVRCRNLNSGEFSYENERGVR